MSMTSVRCRIYVDGGKRGIPGCPRCKRCFLFFHLPERPPQARSIESRALRAQPAPSAVPPSVCPRLAPPRAAANKLCRTGFLGCIQLAHSETQAGPKRFPSRGRGAEGGCKDVCVCVCVSILVIFFCNFCGFFLCAFVCFFLHCFSRVQFAPPLLKEEGSVQPPSPAPPPRSTRERCERRCGGPRAVRGAGVQPRAAPAGGPAGRHGAGVPPPGEPYAVRPGFR